MNLETRQLRNSTHNLGQKIDTMIRPQDLDIQSMFDKEREDLDMCTKLVENVFCTDLSSDRLGFQRQPFDLLATDSSDQEDNGSFFDDKNVSKAGRSTEILKTWTFAHADNPYPTEEEKEHLQRMCSLTSVQLRNWLNNMRKRHCQPIRDGREPRSYTELILAHEMIRMNTLDLKRIKSEY